MSELTVLVYSDDAGVRDAVRTALGRRPSPDLGRLEYVEASTGDEVIAAVDGGGIDLAVLDGEAWPTGGFGLAKQLKDEIADAPATLVLLKREVDAWLATWALADAVVAYPLDAMALTSAAVEALKARESGLPVKRTRVPH
jgi:DNA-binding NtrC family response regulator